MAAGAAPMTRLPTVIMAAALAFAGLVAPGRAAFSPGSFEDLAFAQRPGAQIPPDALLDDEGGVRMPLSAFLRGRPAIVVLDYLRCPNFCGLVLGSLAEGLTAIPFRGGVDYDVLAISIDPHEGPAQSAQARAEYGERFGAAALAGWHFLTAPEAQTRRIAEAVGFPYRLDPGNNQYAHPAGIVVASPDARVSRYLLGADFRPLDLRLAVAEASQGTIAAPAERFLLLCYGYDARTGAYTPALMALLKGAGAVTVALGGALLLRQLRRDARS